MTSLQIDIDDLDRDDVIALIKAHNEFAEANSPLGKCHYFSASDLKKPEVTFLTARDKGILAGCAALIERPDGLGELKSMHTSEPYRGKGIAKALVRHIILEATRRGYQELALETGSSAGFAPSRHLYETMGFARSEPFGDYRDNGFSVFMSRQL